MDTITINGIAYTTLDKTEDETLTLATFKAEGEYWNLAILVSKDGEPYTTADWQGEQPTRIIDCPKYEWVRAADWVLYDHDARDAIDNIIDVLGN